MIDFVIERKKFCCSVTKSVILIFLDSSSAFLDLTISADKNGVKNRAYFALKNTYERRLETKNRHRELREL